MATVRTEKNFIDINKVKPGDYVLYTNSTTNEVTWGLVLDLDEDEDGTVHVANLYNGLVVGQANIRCILELIVSNYALIKVSDTRGVVS